MSDYAIQHKFRTARKSHRCANTNKAERGVAWAQICARTIEPGQQYAEGEMNPDNAGGFGHDRYCMACFDGGCA